MSLEKEAIEQDSDSLINKLTKELNNDSNITSDFKLKDIAIEKATSLLSIKFFNSGLYQVISFLLISIAWTVGNGWYVFVSVFSGIIK